MRGQIVTIGQSFTGTTAPGWVLGGTGYTPTLTAASGGDPVGSGWLEMTSASQNEATYAYDATPFGSANATITAQFNYASFNGTGADGITFFLADASQPFAVGAYGGSLGYAQKTLAGGGGADINGMSGGYLGLGLDEFGNYSNPTEGRIGGPGFTTESIAVRGPGSGLGGYNYLGGTSSFPLSQYIAHPSETTRPSGSEAETIQIVLTSTNQLSVNIEFGTSGVFTQIFTADLSAYTRPNNLIMGFTAGTGANTDIHEIQNVLLSSIPANLWTNTNGNSQWTTAANWYGNPAVVPQIGSDVLLNDKYVSTAQNIAVAGTQIIRSLQMDAPFSYTLTGGTLEFNNEGVVGPTGIIITASNGTAVQTINSALQADNAMTVQNNSGSTLALTGAFNTNGQAVSFSGSGNVTASGNVTGTGSIWQTGTGTTTLSGSDTYSGGTTVSAGTLNANSSTALGTGGVTLAGGTLGSTNNSTVSNAIALTGDAGLSGITSNGVLTQTGSNTLTMTNATQAGTVNLAAAGNATQQTLTVEVDTGTSTISGVVANGGTNANGLAKTGAGTLILSNANTYTGGTALSAGTLDVNNNAALGTGTLTLSGGTLSTTSSGIAINNAISLTGSAAISGVTSGGVITQTGSDTLNLSNVTQTGAVNLAASGNATVQNLTVEVDSGTSKISGVIANGGTGANGIDKTGAGTLILGNSAASPTVNTYTGATVVGEGTLQLANSNAIGASSAVTLANGSTLNLAGYSDKVGNLAFTNGTIDFGAGNSGNTLVVNNLTSGSGVLTLANFNLSTDKIGSLTSGISSTLLNEIYFAGYGSGAVEAGSQTNMGNSEGNAYLIAPVVNFTTFTGTTGSTNGNWTIGSNWGGTAPSTNGSSTQKLDFIGNNYATATMNGAYSANVIKFDAAASAVTIAQSSNILTMSGTLPSLIQDSANAQTISGGKVAFGTNNGVIDVADNAGALTINSVITGSGNLTKVDGGTLILGGANTFNGKIDISDGTVQATNAAGLGTATTTVEDGATLALNSSGSTFTNALNLTGAGVNGGGALQVMATATESGAISLKGNTTISTSSGATSTLTGGISGTGLALTINGAGNTSINSNITTGTGGSVTINSTGTTTFTPTSGNNYTGATTVNAGTLVLAGTSGTAVKGDLVINGATVSDTAGSKLATTTNVTINTGTLNLNNHSDNIASLSGTTGSTVALGTGSIVVSGSTSTTYAGTITGSAGSLIDKSGTGTLALTGSNTGFLGTTTVDGGNLSVSGNPNALGTGAVTVKTNGTLQVGGNITMTNAMNLSSNATNGSIENLSGNNTLSGAVTVSGNTAIQSDAGILTLTGAVGGAGNTLTVAGASNTVVTNSITGTGSLVKNGNGTLVLTGANASTFTGTVVMNAGAIQTDNVNALGASNAITLNTSAVLNLDDFNQTVKSVSGSGAINFGSSTNERLTLLGGTSTLSGSFTGYGTLVIGAGETVTLGSNYNAPNINIELAGGTLYLNGTNDTFGALTVTNTSTLDFGSGTTSSDVVFSTVGVSTGATLNVTGWTNGSDYFYSTSSTGAQGSAPNNQIVFSGYTGSQTRWNTYDDGPDNNHQITPAPEPGTYGAIMVGLSLAGLVLYRRRAKAAAGAA